MTSAWTSFVEELATQWDVIERLMADHRPNAAGLCVECTTPGCGTPQASWPCSLWTLADAAREAALGRRAIAWSATGSPSTPCGRRPRSASR